MAIFQQDAFFWRLINLTRSLATVEDRWKLFEAILEECQAITHCDGATLYLLQEDQDGRRLDYAMIQNRSLGINQKFREPGESALTPIQILECDSDCNNTHAIAAHCAVNRKSICVEDVYSTTDFNICGIQAFDELFDYRTRSVLNVPVVKHGGKVLGVIQLINPQNPLSGTVAHYSESQISIVEALAGILATLLDNVKLEQAQGGMLIRLSQPNTSGTVFQRVLSEAMTITHADGGTIYWYRQDGQPRLEFVTMKNQSLGLDFSTASSEPLAIAPLQLEINGEPNLQNVATFTAITKQVVNIDDAYHNTTFDFSGMKIFDQQNQYYSKSFLSVPLLNHEQEVIGVMQLINARDSFSQEIIPFAQRLEPIVQALASYAALTLENDMLAQMNRGHVAALAKPA
ncbi:MAG: GAF domain-containing protein [Pseudomonadales bacterium]|nr:GAF domain-containing protein [Pseudomonadales bacterium]